MGLSENIMLTKLSFEQHTAHDYKSDKGRLSCLCCFYNIESTLILMDIDKLPFEEQ